MKIAILPAALAEFRPGSRRRRHLDRGGPGRQLSNAAELDAPTTSNCPDALPGPKALGVQSFSAALG